MAEAGGNETENDLSALLDSALADFGRTRNTDNELDSMMDTMDQQAVQKAAQKFDDVMKTLHKSNSHPVLFHLQDVNSPEAVQMTAEERKAAENFQNMLKTLVEAEQKALNEHSPSDNDQDSFDRASAEAFIGQLKASFFCGTELVEVKSAILQNLSEQDPANIVDESQYKTLMNLIQAFFSKDLMYPPLKQLLERFPKYIHHFTSFKLKIIHL
uniref:Peroxin-19 n=1 Tax=Elaeophora elaphi TaxID=1147741 RepID=A0A0R3RTU6_9BILA